MFIIAPRQQARPWRMLIVLAFLVFPCVARGDDDFERPPILYSKARPSNAIERLQEKIDSGAMQLPFHDERGYLSAILRELQVPRSSQVLVFSKTSMQRQHISPKSPRAIYFNDELYIGFCQNAQVLEISAVDPHLGAVFYTLDQEEATRPRFTRQTDSCLLCHASSQTKYVPGHTLRSVFSDRTGEAILSQGTTRVDQSTPFERRWGGWYVTGTHGKQSHVGNQLVKPGTEREVIEKNAEGQNITNLERFFDTTKYETPHSDIVALMVLEHQTEAHNFLARASIQTRLALHFQTMLNKELDQPPDYQSESTARRIRSICEPLVRYFLFSAEAKLTDRIQGTSTFATDFEKKGPRDSKGRSLRDLDLERRLFKYPCSYLIYSDAFAQLPIEAKNYVYQLMYDVLSTPNYGSGFSHLDANDRQAILEILRDTKKDLPDYWRR